MDPIEKLKSKFVTPSRRTLGLKRATPASVVSSATLRSANDSHSGDETPSKKTRLVLPTQSGDNSDLSDDDSEPSAAAVPPTHAYLLSRNQPPAKPQADTVSIGNGASSASPAPSHGPYYLCTWRKPQYKKHKTWDGDALLIVKDQGAKCTLLCAETGKELVTSAKFPYGQLSSGDALALGGKEIEVERELTPTEYRETIAVTRGEHSPAKRGPPPVAIRSTKPFIAPTKRPAITPVDLNKIAPARAETFYGKPSPTAALTASAQKRASSPVKPSGLVNPGQGKTPHPRFDPDEPGAIVMQRPSVKHQKRHNKDGLPIVDVVLDPQLAKSLRPHQVEGVKFLYERVMGMHADGEKGYGAILADEMGLGKTLQTIALILTLMKQSCYYTSASCTIERAMIVCPLTLVKNWKREFRKWIGNNALNVLCIDEGRGRPDVERFVRSKAYHVLVIGYEKLRSCIDILKHAQPPVGLLVCDEGHRLKSRDAKTTLMFQELTVERKIILSGTPIQNDLSELYNMIDFVVPDLLGSPGKFKSIFEEPIVRSRAQHCSKQTKELGQARASALRVITQDIILRRTADILSNYLPPKQEMVLFCAPSRTQLQIYQSILGSHTIRSILRGDAGNALLQIGILRKLCNSPELLLKDAEGEGETATKALVGDVGRFFPPNFVRNDAQLSGKLLCVTKLLKTIRATTDDKVVIVSNFTSTLDIVEVMMRKMRYAFVRLDGKTHQDERMEIVNRFNREGPSNSFVFLLSAKSGGVGLNLIGANRLILVDSDWNPSTDLQAMARIHRDGQKKRCYIYRLLLSGTMDEKIYQRQLSKLGLSDSLMDAKKTSSDTFSQEELKDIFTLHTNSTCISHQQLDCDCDRRGGGSGANIGTNLDENAASQASDRSSDDLPGFVAASQHVVNHEARNREDKRKKLVALHKWAHYDSVVHPDAFQDDEIVAQVIRQGQTSPEQPKDNVQPRMETRVVKEEPKEDDSWSKSMLDRADDLFFDDPNSDADAEEKEEPPLAEPLLEEEFLIEKSETGKILFVFSKGSEDSQEPPTVPTPADSEPELSP